MKKLLGALALALFAQSAYAQLAAEGLIIGLKRNQALACIDKLASGGAPMLCSPDSDDRFNDNCISSAVTGLTVEGHAVNQLYMKFVGKRLALLEVTFADRDLEPALASLIARMTEQLGEPTRCFEDTGGCEWTRDGQALLVIIMEPGNLTLEMLELEFKQDIWLQEEEFDDLYPIPEPRTKSPRRNFSMR